jgi:MbtH protein
MTGESEATSVYQVVANDEEQFSIWPAEKLLPDGWHHRGVTGTRDECLDYIETTWTDMRPLSLRKWMESQQDGKA